MARKHGAPRRGGRGGEIVTVLVLDAAVIGIGILVGWLVDRVAESTPLLSLLGLVVGLIVAAVLTWSRLHPSDDEPGS
jgi:F0F1-type ATP synthase assembly protein I